MGMTDFLKVYTQYVKNFSAALTRLNELMESHSKFKKWLEKQLQAASGKKMYDLPSYLITPVQRIPRYYLLLKSLSKKTWKDHPDYESLKIATEKAKEIAGFVNQNAKDAENLQKVIQLQNKFTESQAFVTPQ